MRMIWHRNRMDMRPMTSIHRMPGMSMVMSIITIIRKSTMTMDTMMRMEMNLVVDVEGKDEEVDLVDGEEIEEEAEGDAVDEVQEKGKRMMKRWRWKTRTEAAAVVKDEVDDAPPGNTIREEDQRVRMAILLRMVEVVVVDVITNDHQSLDDRRPTTGQQFGLRRDHEVQINHLRLTLVITRLKVECPQKEDVVEIQRVLSGSPKVPSNTLPIMAYFR